MFMHGYSIARTNFTLNNQESHVRLLIDRVEMSYTPSPSTTVVNTALCPVTTSILAAIPAAAASSSAFVEKLTSGNNWLRS